MGAGDRGVRRGTEGRFLRCCFCVGGVGLAEKITAVCVLLESFGKLDGHESGWCEKQRPILEFLRM